MCRKQECINSLGCNDKGNIGGTGGLYEISGNDYVDPRRIVPELVEINLNQIICNMLEFHSLQLARWLS